MYIATTRFNNKTYVENMKWKIKNNFNGCCYGLPHKISEHIPPYKTIIVLEMNNDINKLMGIGCIKNYLRFDNNYRIHKDPKFNRYFYTGKKKRIDRTDIDENILEHLEYLLFKTSQHYKRLRGITRIKNRRLGEKLDIDFNIGDMVKKIKGEQRGQIGIIVKKNNNKITVKYEENNEIKFWSSRYALTNYIKLNKIKKTYNKKIKKGCRYKCSLCGQLKKEHNCYAIIYSKKLETYIYNYLISLFHD
tara:strand:- start:3781 stop:4524 length:744 start_codon:yes stop_codon:yes gene_type:complete